jgi:pSer/pThr/pTyr-binding forkhead associated (FHA) protein
MEPAERAVREPPPPAWDEPTLRAPASNWEPMQVVVTIAEGPWGNHKYESLSRVVVWFGAGQTVVIGRDLSGTDLAITRDPGMAPSHFQLECDGHQCRLRDLRSPTGTWINGQRVSEAIVRNGDTIRAGGTTFRVAVDGGPKISDTNVEFSMIKPPPDGTHKNDQIAVPPLTDIDHVFSEISRKMLQRRAR